LGLPRLRAAQTGWRIGEVIDTATASTALLERSAQLDLLADARATVAAYRQGRLLLVAGEAGVGKTALVRAFCDGQTSSRVLWGSCDALFTPRPLGPFVDIAAATGGEVEAVVEGSNRPHEVVAALGREVERAEPTIVVLDDVHWADEATLDVLRLLGRRVDRFPALVIATYREDELGDRHPLRTVLGELATARAVQRVELERLSPEAVTVLAEPYGIDPDALYARTAGNPFFVSEVLESGTAEIPPTVRDAVLARAARLSPGARGLLEALAVSSPPAELDVLEAVAGEAIGHLDECIGAGMAVPSAGTVAFRHELARLVIDSATPPTRRVALHARALQALDGASDPARLAHHAEAAGDAPQVLRFGPEAARRAAAVGAHRESVAQYARALRFADALPPGERAELLERRAYECLLTEQAAEAVSELHKAIELRQRVGDVHAQAADLYLLSNALWCPGWATQASDAARQAVEILDGVDPGRELAMAYARFAQLCMDAEDADGAVAWGTRAIDLAARLGEHETGIHALNSVGTARFAAGDDEGREQLQHSLALATEAGLEEHVARGGVNFVSVALRHRDYDLTQRQLEPSLAYTTERGLEIWRSYLLGYRSAFELDLGRWDDALQTAATVVREPRRSRLPRVLALVTIARVRARRGEDGVTASLDEALALLQRSFELQAALPVAVARAEVAWLAGDREGVDEASAEALELARRRRSRWAVAELAAWRTRAGIVDEIEVSEMAGPCAIEAAGDWRAAAAQWDRLGCPYEAALARAELPDEDDNGPRIALEELYALGALPAAAIVARGLRERGARGLPRGPRAQTRSNPAGLTARELDVAALLQEGLRNAEIAQRLVISEKTAGHHVSAILRKLDVRTRAEAGARTAQLGLTQPWPDAGRPTTPSA
jgi:DNA-binding CsgD family transcriptional regulator